MSPSFLISLYKKVNAILKIKKLTFLLYKVSRSVAVGPESLKIAGSIASQFLGNFGNCQRNVIGCRGGEVVRQSQPEKSILLLKKMFEEIQSKRGDDGLNRLPKFYNNVFLFVGLTILGTLVNFH